MRFTVLLYLVFSLFETSLVSAQDAPEGAPSASIDLRTAAGVALVKGQWRYSDVELVQTTHRAPDARGQPTGAAVATWSLQPQAGVNGFDDSDWPVIAPDTLDRRRGNGRISFNWYRIAITVPEAVGATPLAGSTLVFTTAVDDYAEVWVDGELAHADGQSGGSVVKGWKASNRVLITRNAVPGRTHQIAVFGANGPLSDPPTNFIWMAQAQLEVHPGQATPVAVTPQEVNVRVVRLDPALDAIVPANPKLFKLAEGFLFTEGPVWSRDAQALLFSDPNANRIYAYREPQAGQPAALSVFRDRSGYSGADIAEYGQPGSNGLTFDRAGRLTINQHGNRQVVRVERDGTLTVLADGYQGKQLNSPNDLVYRADGAVYFTDPPFGLPKAYDDPRKELPFSGIYRSRNGKTTLLSRELEGPNGIAFSPDERFLYVGNWDPQRKAVLRFPVHRDGSLGASEVFLDMTAAVPGDEALDGLKVDQAGNLYVCAPDGLRIYSAAGKHLGTVIAPRPIHNAAWGDDGTTLYLTARDRLYRIALLTQGVRP